jgi:3-isopropylmalate dehydrogenase
MLLRHSLGLEAEALCVEKSVSDALDASVFTADLTAANAVSTQAATQAVVRHLQQSCHVVELRD